MNFQFPYSVAVSLQTTLLPSGEAEEGNQWIAALIHYLLLTTSQKRFTLQISPLCFIFLYRGFRQVQNEPTAVIFSFELTILYTAVYRTRQVMISCSSI